MRATRFASIVSLVLLWLAAPVSARGGMPNPLTPRGEVIEAIYYKIFVVGVLVFLFVMALLIFVMIRYRASSGHGRETFELERENLKLEMTWIIIPLFIMLWIGFISYAGLVQLDEGIANEDAEMELHIVGAKWYWTAEYDDFKIEAFPDSIGGLDENEAFYVPANVPIKLNMTSADVIHAFSIHDANWASVGMVDANPTGPHKYNSMIVEFPEGEYHVQCREMCFNPGHAYMRATIVSVPQADYEAWYEAAALEANAPKLAFAIEIDDNGITAPIMKTASNTAILLQFANNGTTDLTFTLDGVEIAVPAGGFVPYTFLPDAVGNYEITSAAGSLFVDVVVPTEVDVELGDFYISPTNFVLEAGTLYRINLDNVGGSPHNLFLGSYTDADNNRADWESDTYSPKSSGSFLVLVQEPMSFDTWCDVPGHAPSGMLARATVT